MAGDVELAGLVWTLDEWRALGEHVRAQLLAIAGPVPAGFSIRFGGRLREAGSGSEARSDAA